MTQKTSELVTQKFLEGVTELLANLTDYGKAGGPKVRGLFILKVRGDLLSFQTIL